jgi:hypothetical protein
MRCLLSAAVVAFLVGAAAPVRADPLHDAQAAYDRGKYAVALDLWQPLGEQGNPDAQAGLGSLYLGGYGVARDEAAAMAWFRKAAEQGHAGGQFSLASLYYARKEYGPAASWYRRAAEQGNALAQIRLARLYAEGPGLARDDVQAYKWFAVAACEGPICMPYQRHQGQAQRAGNDAGAGCRSGASVREETQAGEIVRHDHGVAVRGYPASADRSF